MKTIRRGELWLVDLDPTIGSEIRKTRPVVVVSSDAIGILPIRLVAPLTEWKNYLSRNVWHVRVTPSASNGLAKVSSVDTLQLRGLDTSRFVKRLGVVSSPTLSDIVAAIAAVIEYAPGESSRE